MSTNTMTGTNTTGRLRVMVQIGMLSAVSIILMLFEIPLWFAPGFYKMDFSEVPVMIGAFAMGPLAGAAIELIKIMLNFIITGSVTAGVGEAANFLIGCAFVVPAGLMYRRHKTKRAAIAGMAAGTVIMAAAGALLNAFVLLPAYAAAFGMPIENLVGMGAAVNKYITGLPTFIMFAVTPFNVLKGIMVSVVVAAVYKKISPVLK